MAIWYETGNGMVRTKLAKCNIGIDVYLCCPGPSLAAVKDEDLKVPNVMTVAMNTAYPHIRPDLWIGMDEPECYDKTLWWQSFMKVCRGGYQNRECDGRQIAQFSNVYFIDCSEPKNRVELFERRAHDIHFVWHKNTMAICLHLLVWMGAKKIHLLGCDMGGERDYYDERILSEEQRKYNRRLYGHLKDYLRWFSEEGAAHGVDLISCTPDSPINEYLVYYDLKDALALSVSSVPNPGKVKHVLDVRKDKEKKAQTE
jgi:hypothetical protein